MAESVFIAGMFVKYGNEYAQLQRMLGNKKEATRAIKAVQEMNGRVLDAGWDGKWFLRAYDASGAKVGSNQCEEGKSSSNPRDSVYWPVSVSRKAWPSRLWILSGNGWILPMAFYCNSLPIAGTM